jgi:hypothetical protein
LEEQALFHDYEKFFIFIESWWKDHGSNKVELEDVIHLAEAAGVDIISGSTKSLGTRLGTIHKAQPFPGYLINKHRKKQSVHKKQAVRSWSLSTRLPTLNETTDTDQLNYLRAKVRLLEKRGITLQKSIGEQKEIAHVLEQTVKASRPYPRTWKAPAIRKDKPTVVPVLMWSDWHIGEKIDPRQTEGFGSYSWQEAQDRNFSILDDQLQWVKANRTQYNIEEVQVLALGDYVAGGIHKELEVYAEFDPPVQAVNAGKMMGENLMRLSSEFERVKVERTMGNHDRIWMKPQHKGRATNSWAFVVYNICDGMTARDTSIITTDPVLDIGSKKVINVNGHKILIEHGDNFRAWMGIPYYGIERGLGKETRKRMRLLDESTYFHWHCIGHWHVPALVSNTTFINGSLSGTTEHDHNNNRFSEPNQLAFMVSENHIFNITPFGG